MYVFQNFSGGNTPGPLLVLGPRFSTPPLQNLVCAPEQKKAIQIVTRAK